MLANPGYSIAVFRYNEDERRVKLAFIVKMLMLFPYGIDIRSHVSAAGNIAVAAATILAPAREKRA